MCNQFAYCGLDCGECRAFKATITGDSEWKKTIAKEWSKALKTEFKPEDVNCSGCKSNTISGWCRKICKIRPCAEGRNLETCAECEEYPCVNLNAFLSSELVARNNLEIRRKAIQKSAK